MTALERELGADSELQSLNVELFVADATASGATAWAASRSTRPGARSSATRGATPRGTLPVSSSTRRAMDRITKAALPETGSAIESLTL